jgi:hypothetical protein
MKLQDLIAAPSGAPCCGSLPDLLGRYAICTVFLMILLVTVAQGAQWSSFWDTVAQRPDAKVTDGVNDKGEPTRTIELSSGVRFDLERHGDRITYVDGDISGHGAVRCSWEIYVAIRAHIDACSPGEDPDLEAGLDETLDRINDFIVENSLVPTTKSQLAEAIAQHKQQAKLALLGKSQEDQRKQCEADGIAPFIKSMNSTPRDKLKSGVNDLLSVKRPPVMNPCL